MHRLIFPALLLLVACGTPQQRCVAAATKNIRVLDKLITVTQANVARGYAIRKEEYIFMTREVCGELEGKKVYCNVPETATREVPVAIDLNVEQAKLNSQLVKRSQLAAAASDQIAACKTAYPEG